MVIPSELTRRARKKEETKERIFQAAMALFRQRGFAATTVDDICGRADCAKGTFFNYFPQKEAVFAYLDEQWQVEAAERAAAILADPGPARDRLIEMFVEFAAFYEEDRGLAQLMLQEWGRHRGSPDDELCRRWTALGQEVVRRLQDAGEVRADIDPARGHDVLESVYHGTVAMYVEAPTPPFPLREELRTRLTLVMEGLAPRVPGGR
jgi:AcrR family transcriptional regulator